MYKAIRDDQNDEDDDEEIQQSNISGTIRPLCPTRWLSRAPAVSAALDNYAAILDSLSAASDQFGSKSAAKAATIHHCMASSKCILGLVAAKPILEVFHILNTSLQASTTHVEGMLQSVKLVIEQLDKFRTEHFFSEIFSEAEKLAESLGLDKLVLRRPTKRPARFDDGISEAPTTPEACYRLEFFAVLDAAKADLLERFTAPDLLKYQEMANMLFTGIVSKDVISEYPDLNASKLSSELKVYTDKYPRQTLESHLITFTGLTTDCRNMFPNVEKLIRILLVPPASSCSSERSFSALRRLKTWLRATMKQNRLNHVAVCHIHRERLKSVSCYDIARNFVLRNNFRRKLFGNF